MNTPTQRPSRATAAFALTYAVSAYAAFFASFGYFILCAMGYAETWGLGAGLTLSPPAALGVDLALILGFGLQHSLMARPWFKRALVRAVPPALERATYIWASNFALAGASYFWVSLPGVVWHVTLPALDWALWGLGLVGWLGVAGATFLIDHFELFGLRQAWTWATGRARRADTFRTPGAYRLVRHPMMFAMLIGLWSTSYMDVVRLVLAAAMTLYVVVGVRFEEQDLVALFGPRYERYRARTPQLFPRLLPRASDAGPASTTHTPAAS